MALEWGVALQEAESVLGEGSSVLASWVHNLHGQLKLSTGMHRLPHQSPHEQSAANSINNQKKSS